MTAIAALIGFLFEIYIRKTSSFYVLQGPICGAFIGFLLFTLEYFIFDRISKLSFRINVVIKTIFYSLSVILAFVVSDLITDDSTVIFHDVEAYLLPLFPYIMISVMLFVVIININRLLGQNALLRLFFGKYHAPVIEKRIFMFLDVTGSTSIAEEIGDKQFHYFLNDFFFDLTRPVIESRGEIYKYVGDEVIITWDIKQGLKDDRCINCFFLIEDKIQKRHEFYEKKYGIVPKFSAGLHSGEVVVGELGHYKREIAFLGDVVNTTSRIQAECKKQSQSLIISETLKSEFSKKTLDAFHFINLGLITLRGKKNEVNLYGTSRGAGTDIMK